MIEDMKPDLIFITETWLHPDIKNAEVMLTGFSEPIRKDRTQRGRMHNVCEGRIDAARRNHCRQ